MQNRHPFPKNGRESKNTGFTNCSQVTSLAIIILRFPNLEKSRVLANGKHIKWPPPAIFAQISDGQWGRGEASWMVNHVGHLLCLLLVIMIFYQPTEHLRGWGEGRSGDRILSSIWSTLLFFRSTKRREQRLKLMRWKWDSELSVHFNYLCSPLLVDRTQFPLGFPR